MVYLSGLEDGLFPSRMSIMSDDRTEIEEERRQKAQKKARDQLNYERYQERTNRLYEHEYKKASRQSRSNYLSFLVPVLFILAIVFLLLYFPYFKNFIYSYF